MSELYNVVFRGDILPGHNLPEVKARMAQLFKLDDAKLAMVFSGKPVALKKDCDAATAEKMKTALTQVGADVEIKSSSPVVAATPPRPSLPPAPVPAIPKPAVTAAPIAAAIPRAVPAAQPLAPVTPPPAAGGFKVAGVGALLTEAERAAQRKPPVKVDISHIALEKRASNFMAADEKPALAKRPEIKAPDFGVAAVGSDLLKEDEKRVYEELVLDLSGIQMAELGADMLRDEDKLPLPVMEIEELNIDLAPAGSDMGQIKKAPPPPPPKIDHIKLK